MSNYPRDLRWKCPHCDIGLMKITSAERHLRRKHFECGSCRMERLMVQSIIAGRGFFSYGDPLFGSRRLAEQES